MGVAAVAIGGLIGVFLGVVAGYAGGRNRRRHHAPGRHPTCLPFILLAITGCLVVRRGFLNLVIVLAIGQWVTWRDAIARRDHCPETQGTTSNRRAPSACMGSRIVRRGIPPNILAPLAIVIASHVWAGVILSEAALSFLGWGAAGGAGRAALAESRTVLRRRLLAGRLPCVAIMITVLRSTSWATDA